MPRSRSGIGFLATSIFAVALSLAIAGPTTAAPATKRIAVTIDDLPVQWECLPLAAVQAETKALLRTLVTHHVEAIGFVNESKLYVPGEVDARIALLDDWIAAGMQLGNHGFDHIGFQHTALPAYEDNFIRGDSVTRRLLAAHGGKPSYYRYPYNQTGPTVADRDAFVAFLASRGYAPAPFTIEDDDYVYARVYANDIERGDHAETARVRDAYDANLVKALAAFETMSQALFGRQIAQVFLIHASRLNADTLDRTLKTLEAHGYAFVPFETALADPAYTSPDGYAGQWGASWLRRWADGLKRTITPLGQPDPQDWVQRRYDKIGVVSVQPDETRSKACKPLDNSD